MEKLIKTLVLERCLIRELRVGDRYHSGKILASPKDALEVIMTGELVIYFKTPDGKKWRQPLTAESRGIPVYRWRVQTITLTQPTAEELATLEPPNIPIAL